jgi:carbonic anhydrase
MCDTCTAFRRTRRNILRFGALGALAALDHLSPITAARAADGPATNLTPDQALDQLKAGNRRYVTNPQACVSDLAKRRQELAAAQAPWATIVSCSDSRVPPELVFGGLGLGELFVVRNAGNMVDTAAMGTLEYGAAVLKSPLIVVLGHERCGAVAAACDVVTRNATFPGVIGQMIEPILPAAIAARDRPGDFVDNAVRENVRRTVERLKITGPLISELTRAGKAKVVGAYYGLATGEVEFIA